MGISSNKLKEKQTGKFKDPLPQIKDFYAKGNSFYNSKNYEFAIEEYEKALYLIKATAGLPKNKEIINIENLPNDQIKNYFVK